MIPLKSLGDAVLPGLQMRKMRLREVKDLTQGHTASGHVLQRGLISIPRATAAFCSPFCSPRPPVGGNAFCPRSLQMSSPGWAPSCQRHSGGKRPDSRSASQVVFEALHSLEPRGYVVGWIIAISLLVGILIFLLLAVLLWKVSLAAAGPRGVPACGCPALLSHQGLSLWEDDPVGTSFTAQGQQRGGSVPSGSAWSPSS